MNFKQFEAAIHLLTKDNEGDRDFLRILYSMINTFKTSDGEIIYVSDIAINEEMEKLLKDYGYLVDKKTLEKRNIYYGYRLFKSWLLSRVKEETCPSKTNYFLAKDYKIEESYLLEEINNYILNGTINNTNIKNNVNLNIFGNVMVRELRKMILNREKDPELQQKWNKLLK